MEDDLGASSAASVSCIVCQLDTIEDVHHATFKDLQIIEQILLENRTYKRTALTEAVDRIATVLRGKGSPMIDWHPKCYAKLTTIGAFTRAANTVVKPKQSRHRKESNSRDATSPDVTERALPPSTQEKTDEGFTLVDTDLSGVGSELSGVDTEVSGVDKQHAPMNPKNKGKAVRKAATVGPDRTRNSTEEAPIDVASKAQSLPHNKMPLETELATAIDTPLSPANMKLISKDKELSEKEQNMLLKIKKNQFNYPLCDTSQFSHRMAHLIEYLKNLIMKAERTKNKVIEATKNGDINSINTILDNCHDNETVKYVVQEALTTTAEVNDLELFQVVLGRYKTAVNHSKKAINIHDHVFLLYEFVHKNNTAMMDMFFEVLQNPQFALSPRDEEPLSKLLLEAIDRGCHYTIVCHIAALWRQTVPHESPDALLQRYKHLMAGVRHFAHLPNYDVQDVYTIVSLGLLTTDDPTIVSHMATIAFPTVADEKHNRLSSLSSQRMNPRHKLTYLLTPEITIEAITKWNDHTLRFLSDHRSEDGHAESDLDIYRTITTELDAAAKDTRVKKEIQEVKRAVDGFMTNLCNEIARVEPMLKCTSRLVGSAREGTRCFYPNEFDYLLEFETLADFFKMRRLDSDFFFLLENEDTYSKNLGKLLDTIKQGKKSTKHQFLHADRLKKCLNHTISSAIEKNFTSLWKLLQTPVNRKTMTSNADCIYNLSKDPRLTIEPCGFFTRKDKFSTANLVWRGRHFKDLLINIDLVPVFRHIEHTSLPEHHLLPPTSQLHVVVRGHPIGFQIGYSAIENEFFLLLPKNIRTGYIYAKAIRRGLKWSKHQGFAGDIETLITTYMLKTVLLFLTQRKENIDDAPAVTWAIRIYEQLEKFLETDRRIPHFFLNNHNDSEGECIFSATLESEHQRSNNELLNMLATTARILQVLHSGAKKN